MQLYSCSFINSLPEYVLDRTLIIDNGHEHQVSGYKLAKASQFFKRQLIHLRQGELESSRRRDAEDETTVTIVASASSSSKPSARRVRARSLCDLEPQPLHISYTDLFGLEALLTFIHSSDDETALEKLNEQLTPTNALSMLKAGLHFEARPFLDRCVQEIDSKEDLTSCWQYWKIGDELASQLPQLQSVTSKYLLENFIRAAEANMVGFCSLSLEELSRLLRDDALCCADENQLFRLLEAWIDNEPTKHNDSMAELLCCLRLGRISHEDLTRISGNRYVQLGWQACSPTIVMARLAIEELASNPSAGLPATPSSGDETGLHNYLRRSRLPYAAVFVVGGWEGNQDDPNFGPSRAIQVYNCRSDVWRREDIALDEGHAYSGCVIYKACIYVVGGYVSTGPTQMLKKLDLITCAWKYLSPMHEKRNYVSCCRVDSSIYAIGGHNGRHRLNTVERYDAEQNFWAFVAPMRQVRSDAGADAVAGRIYVVGGFDGHHFYDSVEMFDTTNNQWSLVAPMQNIRSGVSVVAFAGHLYAIGGNDGLQRLRTVERYDPDTNQWQNMPSMIRQRSNFCVTVFEGNIYVMGGWSDESNSTISLVECWQPSMLTRWRSVHELFLPASANCCCTVVGMELVRDFTI